MPVENPFEFLYVPIPRFVRNELTTRSNSREYAQRPRTAWIRFTSNFDDGRVMMGGTLDKGQSMQFGFNNLYDSEGIPPKRPKPGVTGVNISEQGHFLEATVNWTAWSLDQLQENMKYFMNPAASALIEIGWSDMEAGTDIINVNDDQEVISMYHTSGLNSESGNPIDYTEHPRYNLMESAGGKYQIIAGVIVDFSFSINNQGGFDCTTTLQDISESAFSLSHRVNYGPRASTDLDPNKNMVNLIKEELGFKTGEKAEKESSTRKQEKSQNVNRQRQAGTIAGGVSSGTSSSTNASSTPQRKTQGPGQTHYGIKFIGSNKYIPWWVFEDVINEAMSKVSKNNPNVRLFEFNSNHVQISYFRKGQLAMKSSDPNVCIVAAREFSSNVQGLPIPQFDGAYNGSLNGPQGVKSNERAGWLSHLYITDKTIKEAIETNDNIVDAVKQVLKKCSNACYNIWDFEVVPESNNLIVVDRNYAVQKSVEDLLNQTDDSSESALYRFDAFSTNSQIRSMNFSSNLSDQVVNVLAAKELLTNGSTQSEDKPIIDGVTDSTGQLFKRFQGRDLVFNALEQRRQDDSDSSDKDISELVGLELVEAIENGEIFPKNENIKSSSVNAKSSREFDAAINVEDLEEARQTLEERGTRFENIDAASVFPNAGEYLVLEREINSDEDPLSAINANSIIDVELSFTLTGIAGLRRYQLFQMNHVPEFYRENGLFLIDSVSHSIQNNDWTTEVTAKYVVGNLYKKNIDEGI